MAFSSIPCFICEKRFLKDNRHINENKKLNHKSYCSLKCQSSFKNKQVELVCENTSCQNRFKRNTSSKSFRNYCSMKCWAKAHEISKEELINQIKLLSLKLGRTPTRRECKYSTSCQKYFGSWTNALIIAGLTPHRSLNQRMYKRRKCVAKDGHICNKDSEVTLIEIYSKDLFPEIKLEKILQFNSLVPDRFRYRLCYT